MQSSRYIAGIGAFLLPCALLAQVPAVTSVVNSVSCDARLSPGVVAQVRFAPVSTSDLDYNAVSVAVGNYGAATVGVSTDSSGGGIATAVLPRELVPGASTVSVTTRHGTSAPFPIALDSYAPAFLPPWSHCESGSQIGFISGVGLGPTDPPSPSYGYPPLGQTYPTVANPYVTVGAVPAEVQSSLAYPPSGDYQIKFKVSPDTPEGIQPVAVNIGGVDGNTVNMLVGAQHQSAVYLSDSGGHLPEAIQTAPESMLVATSCAIQLGKGEFAADAQNPATTLEGTSVQLTDSAGVARLAPILSVSPLQVKYVVPADAANGRAQVTIALDGRVVSTSQLDINTVQPFVFPAWNTYLVRLRNGVQTLEPVPVVGWFSEGLIDLGPETDQVYLVMSATGLRNRTSLEHAHLHIDFDGGIDVPVQYAGPQSQYPGLDQVNVLLPRFLPGTVWPEDRYNVQLIIDGKGSNVLAMHFMQTDSAK